MAESGGKIFVDWIDWGDNLESVDWYTRSQVRTEVVLFQDLPTPMREYEMRHTSGWGIDEVHGLATDLAGNAQPGPGTRATVYSPCARLTIQKLLVPREELCDLTWDLTADEGDPAWIGSCINPRSSMRQSTRHLMVQVITMPRSTLKAASSSATPGMCASLMIVNGGTAAGDYRITFSFDQTCGTVNLNTFFGEVKPRS